MVLSKCTVVNFNEIEKGMIEEVNELLDDYSYIFREQNLKQAAIIVERAIEALGDVLELNGNCYEEEVAD